MNKRTVLAIGAGFSAFAAVTASAATLGGLTPASIGSDNSVIASCDTDGVTVSYTTTYSNPDYLVDGVTLGTVDPACETGAVKITVRGAGGVLSEVTGVKDANVSQTFPVPLVDAVKAQDVTGVAVVIVVGP